ncbi:bifunctional ADP-dependent NAD(P)H-hydrate dehydratase/NAD(P)H-hydrate epimerase [Chryseobacterium populi]|uniref:Bifunctional NAD(P)H-hydrate repair enzyme n=1 Tax=Chryseobacterium populi TaxID=1144316 RepID=J3CJ91_9FLAO|nr:bifunctional ADP-dependent NAD(P)H-hydrate dehydratase/NAD(P)H-hydrate epimerase [Chryseobacterium populi]EJL72714.1 yjeF-like protein, hydroxyethylthiazole kinase-related protein [Chryseobacterium populi]
MKIFTAEQIRQCDQYTISNEPVSSIQLMERAAQACADWIAENCKDYKTMAVFCGLGNNGGDGFAIARMLYLKGFEVDIFINGPKTKFSEDAEINLKRLKEFSGISIINFDETHHYRSKTVIIDALFGTGLSRPLDAGYKDIINELNLKNSLKISIDIPSGLFPDQITAEDSVIFKADYTLSFQFWKRSFLHPETGIYAGKVVVLDIDLNEEYISGTETDYFVIDDEVVGKIFRPRQEFSHKGTHGKATMVAGSYGKIGAAVLSTRAALKAGAGLTFTLAPRCGYEILQTSCPEAMFVVGGEKYINSFEIDENSACGIGPGLGTDPETGKNLLQFLKDYSKPLILDADALNIISENKKNLKLIPQKSIITPHPKEFERLFGAAQNSFERLELARKKAAEFNIYIVLKDHHTQIITPEGKVYYNITGNAGLAKGGSGDILTGIITSLLAQGYTEEYAAVFGVWIHGKAADFAAEKYSKESMLPTDVINELGNVFEEINTKISVKL